MPEIDFKEFIGGTAAGIARVLSGQPFDIIKVRLVASSTSGSIPAIALSIFRNEGLFAF